MTGVATAVRWGALLIVCGLAVAVGVAESTAVADTTLQPVREELVGELAGDGAGSALAMSADGTRIAVGAPGSPADGIGPWTGRVRIFDWDGATWIQVGGDIDGESAGEFAGAALAMSADGTRIAVGFVPVYYWFWDVSAGDEPGRVRVFDWDGAAWVQVGGDIDGEAAGDLAGSSLAMSADGARLAVGAPTSDAGGVGDDAGRVQVFDFDGRGWVQAGASLDGLDRHEREGSSVALSADGSRLAIGAPQANGTGGRVRVYDWSAGGWTQIGGDIVRDWLDASIGTSLALSSDGHTLGISGQTYVWVEDGADDWVWVYRWDGSRWTQVGDEADPQTASNAIVQLALSADGERVAYGVATTRRSDRPQREDSGQVRVSDWQSASWQAAGQLIGQTGDRAGQALAISADGSMLAVGAPGAVEGAGAVRLYTFVETSPTTEPPSTTAPSTTSPTSEAPVTSSVVPSPSDGALPATGRGPGTAGVAAAVVVLGFVLVGSTRRRST